ncbi:MAG: RHS repeat-associated core domain-containing protein [Chthonomonadales bacterium]
MLQEDALQSVQSNIGIYGGSPASDGRFKTDAFGNNYAADLYGQPYEFCGGLGYWYEADLGMHYVRARWYDPKSGTWLSVDPVQSEPRYSYVHQMPTVATDPSGTEPDLQNQVGNSSQSVNHHQGNNPLNQSDFYRLNAFYGFNRNNARTGLPPVEPLQAWRLAIDSRMAQYSTKEIRQHQMRLNIDKEYKEEYANSFSTVGTGIRHVNPLAWHDERDFLPNAPGDLSDPDLDWTEQAITVRSKVSLDVYFDLLKKFYGYTGQKVSTTQVTAVGQYITFTFSGLPSLGQNNFDVQVIKLRPKEHLFVVQTLNGHILKGYRYWKVTQLPGGRVRVSTGSVDKSAGTSEEIKGVIARTIAMFHNQKHEQFAGWENMLRAIVTKVDPKSPIVSNSSYPPIMKKTSDPQFGDVMRYITTP